jgi:hypothetical protein
LTHSDIPQEAPRSNKRSRTTGNVPEKMMSLKSNTGKKETKCLVIGEKEGELIRRKFTEEEKFLAGRKIDNLAASNGRLIERNLWSEWYCLYPHC